MSESLRKKVSGNLGFGDNTMIDKYKEINIYEIENGWLVKILPSDSTREMNQVAYTSHYCKDYAEVNKILKKEIK